VFTKKISLHRVDCETTLHLIRLISYTFAKTCTGIRLLQQGHSSDQNLENPLSLHEMIILYNNSKLKVLQSIFCIMTRLTILIL